MIHDLVRPLFSALFPRGLLAGRSLSNSLLSFYSLYKEINPLSLFIAQFTCPTKQCNLPLPLLIADLPTYPTILRKLYNVTLE